MNVLSSLFDSTDEIDARLNGTPLSLIVSELLTNSGHFFMLNILSEIAWKGWIEYFREVGHYLIIFAMLIQCWYLSRPQAHRFWGNLIGSFIYTVTDLPLDGLKFFEQLNHDILWVFSVLIAILQGLRFHWFPQTKIWVIPLESLTRMGMLFALYLSLAWRYDPVNASFLHLSVEYKFLVSSLMILGLLIGLQSLQVTFQREKIQITAKVLKKFAQWGMGRYAVKMGITNPQQLECQRQNRSIVFIDIRGFTPWCEKNTPDNVATLLSSYYQVVEPAATIGNPLKVTLTGDEVMAIYSSPELAIVSAKQMQKVATELLIKYGLTAGCAVHGGSVIEGVIGSNQVRTYAVIGDVVNTAKRLENATPGGEITISETIYQALLGKIEVKSCEAITAKGKSEPLKIWRLVF